MPSEEGVFCFHSFTPDKETGGRERRNHFEEEIVTLLCATAMTCTLFAGCSGGSDTADTSAESTEETAETSDADTAEETDALMRRIQPMQRVTLIRKQRTMWRL